MTWVGSLANSRLSGGLKYSHLKTRFQSNPPRSSAEAATYLKSSMLITSITGLTTCVRFQRNAQENPHSVCFYCNKEKLWRNFHFICSIIHHMSTYVHIPEKASSYRNNIAQLFPLIFISRDNTLCIFTSSIPLGKEKHISSKCFCISKCFTRQTEFHSLSCSINEKGSDLCMSVIFSNNISLSLNFNIYHNATATTTENSSYRQISIQLTCGSNGKILENQQGLLLVLLAVGTTLSLDSQKKYVYF